MCVLGVLMGGLFCANPAAAFSYLGADVLGNSGDQEQITFLNNWFEPDLPKTEAMASGSNSKFGLKLTVEQWEGKASHFGMASIAPPVPIPAAAWLLGSGLVGLMGIRMRRKQR